MNQLHFTPRIFFHIYLYQKSACIFNIYFLPRVKIKSLKIVDIGGKIF